MKKFEFIYLNDKFKHIVKLVNFAYITQEYIIIYNQIFKDMCKTSKIALVYTGTSIYN